MKIAIICASSAGLILAINLSKAGHKVTVYEKQKKRSMGHPWHDFVSEDFFKEIKYTLKGVDVFYKNSSTFDIFNYSTRISVKKEGSKKEYAISRKDLAAYLLKRAKKRTKIKFNKTVKSLLLREKCVIGVHVGGKEHHYDLVIDNSGINSNLRYQLKDILGIIEGDDKKNILTAYRAVFSRNDIALKHDTVCYLKHMGEAGLSWVFAYENSVDVLVGRMEKLTAAHAKMTLGMLKSENPVIGDKILSGGGLYKIPVRYPASRMFADGYILIGDNAFMTIPLSGSGVHASVTAANILSNILIHYGAEPKYLYEYQRKFYKKLGNLFCEIDIMRRFLLGLNNDELLFLFEKGIIDRQDLQDTYNAKPLNYTFSKIFDKIKKGIDKPFVLAKLALLVRNISKLKSILAEMPEKYDEQELRDWQKKIDGFFSKNF